MYCITSSLFVCVYVCLCRDVDVHHCDVESRGQIAVVGFLLPPLILGIKTQVLRFDHEHTDRLSPSGPCFTLKK